VDADAAATEFQDTFGSSRWQVPRIEGNLAQLSVSNKTVTHHYVKVLRHAYCHPRLGKYIGTRNQWSPTTLSTVDWPALGAACNQNHFQRPFIVKLTHDILPTRELTSRYDPSTPTACPFCLSTLEHRDHLLQCRHAVPHQWRNTLLCILRKRCDSIHTNPVLLDILIQSLDQWMRHLPPPRPTLYPVAYRKLLREQLQLGWRQIFNGRWSCQWAVMQDRYLIRHFDPIPEPLSGAKWVVTMIHTTWQSVRTLWDLRNGRVYGVDSSTRAQLQKEKIHRELRAIYILRSSMRHCDRDILYATAEEHLAVQPVWAMQNWLRVYTPLVKYSIKEAVRSAVRNVRTISSYFDPVPTPD
jgi:hypothetical protein